MASSRNWLESIHTFRIWYDANISITHVWKRVSNQCVKANISCIVLAYIIFDIRQSIFITYFITWVEKEICVGQFGKLTSVVAGNVVIRLWGWLNTMTADALAPKQVLGSIPFFQFNSNSNSFTFNSNSNSFGMKNSNSNSFYQFQFQFLFINSISIPF